MDALLRYAVLVMCLLLMLSGVCYGKQVYFRDGGIIDCESFWQRGGQVIVKINRDTVLDLERSEIDMKRTFPETMKKSHHLRRKKHGDAVLRHSGGTQTVKSTASPVPVVSQSPKEPSAANPVASASSTTPPAANETVQPEPVPADSSSPPDKAESERRSREAAQMMAEAIQKKDPELLKKAIEAQKSAIQKNSVRSAGISLKFLLILPVICLLIVVSMWVVFEKAGNSGWKSLVPIYNAYILMKISGNPGWWVILLFIPVVGIVFNLLAMLALAGKFGRGALFGVGLCFLPMFFLPALAFGGSQFEG